MTHDRRGLPQIPERLETWERPRTRLWQALAAALGLCVLLGVRVDLEALDARIGLSEEEGARRAPADGSPPDPFAGDPRELHRLRLDLPLACLPPTREWIRQWGDGRLPWETNPHTGQRAWVCVNADLRREVYVP